MGKDFFLFRDFSASQEVQIFCQVLKFTIDILSQKGRNTTLQTHVIVEHTQHIQNDKILFSV